MIAFRDVTCLPSGRGYHISSSVRTGQCFNKEYTSVRISSVLADASTRNADAC
jgi:hypothetical protein